jgi:hypothetical protein
MGVVAPAQSTRTAPSDEVDGARGPRLTLTTTGYAGVLRRHSSLLEQLPEVGAYVGSSVYCDCGPMTGESYERQ